MDIKNLVDSKVLHIRLGIGKIVDIDNGYVVIDFNGNVKKFLLETMSKYFDLKYEETNPLIMAAIEKNVAEKAASDAAKKEIEERRKAAEEEAKKLQKEEAEELPKEQKANYKSNKGLVILNGVLIGLGTNRNASIVIPNHVTAIGKRAFTFDGDFGYEFKNITIPDSVTSIGVEAFAGCAIEKLTIGKGIKTIDISAFLNCRVEKVNYLGSTDDWAKIDFSDVYSNPLYSCGKFYINNKLVTEVSLSAHTKANFLAFVNCDSIKSIVVDDNNPYCKSIDGNLYSKDGKCLIKYAAGKKESSFIIPDCVTEIYDAFAWSKHLTSVTIGRNVKEIGCEAFCGCSALKTVNYIGTVDEWAEIFRGGETQDSINYSAGPIDLYVNGESVVDVIFTTAKEIGQYAFRNCCSLRSAKISNTVKSIGKQAFYGCKSLESVTIPESVTDIGDNAFDGCDLLTNIVVSENNPHYKSEEGRLYTKDGKPIF